MGTQRSPELVKEIASATTFSKMKEGKTSKLVDHSKLNEHVSTFTLGTRDHNFNVNVGSLYIVRNPNDLKSSIF